VTTLRNPRAESKKLAGINAANCTLNSRSHRKTENYDGPRTIPRPLWGGIEGRGVTAAGVDLTSGPPALEIAVDPSVIALGSWV
jgi:3D (Asp-Asp-Asp) domain-containing protein